MQQLINQIFTKSASQLSERPSESISIAYTSLMHTTLSILTFRLRSLISPIPMHRKISLQQAFTNKTEMNKLSRRSQRRKPGRKTKKHTAPSNSSLPELCSCSAWVATLVQLRVFSRLETIQEFGLAAPVLPPPLSFSSYVLGFCLSSVSLFFFLILA